MIGLRNRSIQVYSHPSFSCVLRTTHLQCILTEYDRKTVEQISHCREGAGVCDVPNGVPEGDREKRPRPQFERGYSRECRETEIFSTGHFWDVLSLHFNLSLIRQQRTMGRASDDVLKQRTILKATKLSPPKGATRATADVIHRRRIVKANRSWFGAGSSPPRSPAAPATATPKQRNDATSPCPNPSATSIPEPKAVGRSPTQTTKPAAGEEKALEMRAKLFSRTNAGWAKRGTGTLRLCCTFSGRRSVKLLGENGSVLLDVDVENMMLVSKLIKESVKGNCAYLRFTAEFSRLVRRRARKSSSYK